MSMDKNKKIEEILGSLNGVKRAPAPDFFYTRLKARMEKGFEPASLKRRVLYPVYALATVVVVVFINAAIIFTNNNISVSNETASLSESENLQTIASDDSFNDVSSIYDLNEER